MDTQADTQRILVSVTALHTLSERVGVSERTLRRAAASGTIQAQRLGPRRLRIDEPEWRWIAAYWPTVSALREVLRTEPSVRLAVLFGSVARGSAHRRSDVDLLVDVDDPSPGALGSLEEKLATTAGRRVQLVTVDAARKAPGLLSDALRDGRPVVDRDEHWPLLLDERDAITRDAERGDAELLDAAMRPLEAGDG